jgi:diguanylate cyclase (GGDEF)-like protein/PAS domain S-box-containing protein
MPEAAPMPDPTWGATPPASLDDLPLPVWVNDGTATNAWVNLEQCRLTGRSRAEEVGDDWAASIHPDDRESYRRFYEAALRRREAFRYEYRVLRADGAWRWMLNSAAPRWRNGVFAGFVGCVTDITDRRAAEQDAADRSRVLDTLLELSSMVGRADPDDLDAAIAAALPVVGRGLDLERALLVEVDPVRQASLLLAEWWADGAERRIERAEVLPNRNIPNVAAAVIEQRVLEVADVEALSGEWGDERELTLARGVRSFAVYPFRQSPSRLCALVFDASQAGRDWQRYRSSVQLVVGMIEAAYQRKHLHEAMARRTALERLVLGLSNRFLAYGPQEVRRNIPAAVEYLADALGLSRVVLAVGRGTTIDVAADWTSGGDRSAVERTVLGDVARHLSDGVLVLAGEHGGDACGATGPLSDRLGVRGGIVLPLAHGSELLGFLLLGADHPEPFGDEQLEVLPIVAEVFASAIAIERADAELRSSEERFRLLAAYTPDLVIGFDLEGRVTYTSAAVSRLLGYDPEDLVGQDLLTLLVDEDRPSLRAAMVLVERHGIVEGIELRLQREGGDVVWVEANASGVFKDEVLVAVQVTVRDVRNRKETEARLERLARHDPLTDLLNRRAILEEIDLALAEDDCCLLFVDLDGFKAINDRLGHLDGDSVLVAVADRLRASVRPGDLVARLGGDEFLLLVRDRSVEAAVRVAERLLEAVREPVTLSDDVVVVGASVGLACGLRGESAEELVARADAAMYQAKREGRGRAVRA